VLQSGARPPTRYPAPCRCRNVPLGQSHSQGNLRVGHIETTTKAASALGEIIWATPLRATPSSIFAMMNSVLTRTSAVRSVVASGGSGRSDSRRMPEAVNAQRDDTGHDPHPHIPSGPWSVLLDELNANPPQASPRPQPTRQGYRRYRHGSGRGSPADPGGTGNSKVNENTELSFWPPPRGVVLPGQTTTSSSAILMA
jgi:hypothetical protein